MPFLTFCKPKINRFVETIEINMKLQTTIKFGFLAASLFALNQVNAQQKNRG